MSKPVPVRLARFRSGFLAVWLTALASPAAQAAETRFVSSQAYHHGLSAAYARAVGDGDRVAADLQLARIYDADSPWLTGNLAREAWRKGDGRRAEELGRISEPQSNLLLARIALRSGRSAEAIRRMTRAVLRTHPWDDELVATLADFEGCPEGRMLWALVQARLTDGPDRFEGAARLARARPHSAAVARALEPLLARQTPPPEVVTALARVLHHGERDEAAAALVDRVAVVAAGHPSVLELAARVDAWRGIDPAPAVDAWVQVWPRARLEGCRLLAETGWPKAALKRCRSASPAERATWWLAARQPAEGWKELRSTPPGDDAVILPWIDLALSAGAASAVLRRLDPERVRWSGALWERWARSLWFGGRRAEFRRALLVPPSPVEPEAAGRIHALLARHRSPELADAWLEVAVDGERARIEAALESADRRGDDVAWARLVRRRADVGPLSPPVAARAWGRGLLGTDAEVRRALADLLRRYPDDPQVLAEAARQAAQRGLRARARRLAGRAARRAPLSPDVWALLGETLRDHDRIRARRAWQTALRLYEEGPTQGWVDAQEGARRVREELSRT